MLHTLFLLCTVQEVLLPRKMGTVLTYPLSSSPPKIPSAQRAVPNVYDVLCLKVAVWSAPSSDAEHPLPIQCHFNAAVFFGLIHRNKAIVFSAAIVAFNHPSCPPRSVLAIHECASRMNSKARRLPCFRDMRPLRLHTLPNL